MALPAEYPLQPGLLWAINKGGAPVTPRLFFCTSFTLIRKAGADSNRLNDGLSEAYEFCHLPLTLWMHFWGGLHHHLCFRASSEEVAAEMPRGFYRTRGVYWVLTGRNAVVNIHFEEHAKHTPNKNVETYRKTTWPCLTVFNHGSNKDQWCHTTLWSPAGKTPEVLFLFAFPNIITLFSFMTLCSLYF